MSLRTPYVSPLPVEAREFTLRERAPRERPALAQLPALPRAPLALVPTTPAPPREAPPTRQTLVAPGTLAHAGAGLRAGAVVQPGRPGHFSGAHEAAADLRLAALATPGARRTEPPAAAAPALARCRFTDRASSVSSQAQASAGLGWISLHVECTAPGDALVPAAVAGAGWMDHLTLHGSALQGRAGELSIALQLGTELQAGVNGSAAARLALGVWADGVAVPLLPAPGWGGRPQRGEKPLDQRLACLVVARVPFVFGRPFALAVFALSRAGCEPALPPPPVLPSPAIARASVGTEGTQAPLLSWAGIRAVFAAGQAKPLMHFKQYRLDSATGTDWRPAIGPALASRG